MAVIALLFLGEEDYQTDRARTAVLLVQVKPGFPHHTVALCLRGPYHGEEGVVTLSTHTPRVVPVTASPENHSTYRALILLPVGKPWETSASGGRWGGGGLVFLKSPFQSRSRPAEGGGWGRAKDRQETKGVGAKERESKAKQIA